MNRIDTRYNELKTQNKTALITYLAAGYPNITQTTEIMHSMVKAGADMLEIGVPFSDPVADGVVIQQAYYKAIMQGTGLTQTLASIEAFRKTDQTTPIVLMTYLNPIEIIGHDQFVEQIKNVGVDGVLVVDQPADIASPLMEKLQRQDIAAIYLIAPTTSSDRIKVITAKAQGFIYYVALKGVTGSADLTIEPIAKKVVEIKQHTDLPISVGFGIKDSQTAAAVAKIADGIIIGSELIKILSQHENDLTQATAELNSFLKTICQALD
ncbi:MAG: tryptophan synthase subunit alpha [Pseudomonadota bacterium]